MAETQCIFQPRKRKLKKGDMIRFPRDGYRHYAIYVGDDDIVHMTTTYSGTGISRALGVSAVHRAEVRKDKLEEVAAAHPPGVWEINNYLDDQYEPREADDIVRAALALAEEGTVKYNIIHDNCEHFVTRLRYGVAHSVQVEEAAARHSLARLVIGSTRAKVD